MRPRSRVPVRPARRPGLLFQVAEDGLGPARRAIADRAIRERRPLGDLDGHAAAAARPVVRRLRAAFPRRPHDDRLPGRTSSPPEPGEDGVRCESRRIGERLDPPGGASPMEARRAAVRALRSAALAGVAFLLLTANPSASAPDEVVAFRECAFDWIPWTSTVEEAKAKGKAEGRLVLAFVFPWDAKAYEAGYEGAERVRAQDRAAGADADAQRLRDPGFVKEQAAFVSWLCDPELSACVARSFVPVRLRMHTWHFFEGGPGPFADPLTRLGTSNRETRAPAVVVSTPEGKLVRRVERIGVFDPRLVHRVLLASLRENARYRPAKPKADAELRSAVADRVAGGDLDEARKRLAGAPSGESAWAAVQSARLDAIEGKSGEAAKALAALPSSVERDAALAEVLTRTGTFEEAVKAAGASADPRARTAKARALERLGRAEEASGVWRGLLKDGGDGPVAARARLHLAGDGPRAIEWDVVEDSGAGESSKTTVCGSGGETAAVRYLRSQQDADGAWRDARSTGGGAFDLAVPRTALCACALRAWRLATRGVAMDEAISKAVAFVTKWSEHPSEQVWHLTYALHLELDLLAEKPSDDGKRRARALLEALTKIEHEGGWTYTAPPRLHTFNTAPILLSLVRAKEMKLPVAEGQIERAARFLEANRVAKTRVFHYGPTMEHMSGEKGKTDEKSTCMRTAACELALLAAGAEKGTKGVSEAVDLFLENQAAARGTQKIFESYVDVTSLQDSYRWFFGAWYAAQCVSRLPEAKRKKAASRLDAIVRAEQEIDGSFVDSQMVGKPSSTALALLALAEGRPWLQ